MQRDRHDPEVLCREAALDTARGQVRSEPSTSPAGRNNIPAIADNSMTLRGYVLFALPALCALLLYTTLTPSMPSSAQLPRQVFNPTLYKRILALWFSGIPPGATHASSESLKTWFGGGGPEARSTFDSKCRDGVGDALRLLDPAHWKLPPFESFHEDKRIAPAIAGPFVDHIEGEEGEEVGGGGAGEGRDAKAEATLGLVLLLDQMPRNLFRENQAVIYNHYDRMSQAFVHLLLEQQRQQGNGSDKTLLERYWSGSKYARSPIYCMWLYMPLMHSEDLEDHDTFRQRMSQLKELVRGTKRARTSWTRRWARRRTTGLSSRGLADTRIEMRCLGERPLRRRGRGWPTAARPSARVRRRNRPAEASSS